MKELKKHLSLSDQVSLLISRGLVVSDRQKAEQLLFHVNYYRLSGYLHGFKQSDGIHYLPDTTLEQIQALYDFDRKLTRILMFALEDIEETLKTDFLILLLPSFLKIRSSI